MSLPEDDSLESKCIDAIVANFDIFCAAFRCKENYKFHLDVLQRRWSGQILQKLFQRYLLKDEHLQIVLNKYTTELDFQTILSCSDYYILSSLKEMGEVIQKVSLKDTAVYFNFDNVWSCLPNIHTIDFQRTYCTKESLYFISKYCSHLKHLNLFGCSKVDDKGLAYLAQFHISLEILNVEGTNVTYKGIAYILKEIPSLKKVWHANVPKAILHILGLNEPNDTVANKSKQDFLDRKFQLNNIVISNNSFRPENHLISILENCQKACPYINDLTVTEIVTERQLALCSSFPELTCVNLTSLSHIDKLSINNFLSVRGDKIHSLSLVSFSLSLDVLLTCCPTLQYLVLDYPCFENTQHSNRNSNFINLKRLHIYDDVTDALQNAPSIALLILLCPNLEELNMCRCELAPEVMDMILGAKSLRVLNLSNTSVCASFLVNVLTDLKNLKVLRIDNSGITPDEYDDLMDMVDEMENKVNILWADYTEAIRQLYDTDLNTLCRVMKRQVLKL